MYQQCVGEFNGDFYLPLEPFLWQQCMCSQGAWLGPAWHIDTFWSIDNRPCGVEILTNG